MRTKVPKLNRLSPFPVARALPPLPPGCATAKIAMDMLIQRTWSTKAECAHEMGYSTATLLAILCATRKADVIFLCEFARAVSFPVGHCAPILARLANECDAKRSALWWMT